MKKFEPVNKTMNKNKKYVDTFPAVDISEN